jgi:integrase
MGKRGNGEGSISRRKSGGWCAQYVVFTSEGRKRRTLYGKTRAEVAAKLSKALTPDHVRYLYREKLDSGLSARSVLHIHRTLSKALKQAADDGLIPRNAASSVKPPQPRRQEMQPLTRDQVRAFLHTVEGDHMEALYVLAVAAGLRQGELLALK